LAAALVEVDHRRHAVVEQAIAELKFAGLAHVPSSQFSASAAALTVMAHNLGRAVGILAGPDLQRPPRTPAAQAVLRSWATRALRPGAAPETSRPLVLADGVCHRTGGHRRNPDPLLTGCPPSTRARKPGEAD
jgi:hypothetical protein